MKKILAFLLVLNSTLISNAGEIDLLLQSFCPFKSIAFSYSISGNDVNDNTDYFYSKGRVFLIQLQNRINLINLRMIIPGILFPILMVF